MRIGLRIHTEKFIEVLVYASCGETVSAHEKYAYRESLRDLVRLAMAERRQGGKPILATRRN
jgi:hypothetical protein